MLKNQSLLTSTLSVATTQENAENEFAFSLEEMKWAAEAATECYRRLEKGEVKPLTFRE